MAAQSSDSEPSYGRQPWHDTPHAVPCFCGERAAMKTAWRGEHPGRRFLCCGEQTCKFFKWYDPPMCERAKVIIPGLLKKLNKMEEDAQKLEFRVTVAEKKAKRASMISIVVTFGFFCLVLMFVFM